jgi:hypothetical protein
MCGAVPPMSYPNRSKAMLERPENIVEHGVKFENGE